MTSHIIDKDRIHTYCGLRVSTLSKDETTAHKLPRCQSCDEVIKDGLYVRNHLQTYWETQLHKRAI